MNDEPLMLFGFPVVIEWPEDCTLSREQRQVVEAEMARQAREGVAAFYRNIAEQAAAASAPKAWRARLQGRLERAGANRAPGGDA